MVYRLKNAEFDLTGYRQQMVLKLGLPCDKQLPGAALHYRYIHNWPYSEILMKILQFELC